MRPRRELDDDDARLEVGGDEGERRAAPEPANAGGHAEQQRRGGGGEELASVHDLRYDRPARGGPGPLATPPP